MRIPRIIMDQLKEHFNFDLENPEEYSLVEKTWKGWVRRGYPGWKFEARGKLLLATE